MDLLSIGVEANGRRRHALHRCADLDLPTMCCESLSHSGDAALEWAVNDPSTAADSAIQLRPERIPARIASVLNSSAKTTV
ncbi:hypothetical protein [Streptomyces sp. C184]|uniref:hypothetical protein n=1 Tax=Streptomyces sp. C184 TaxID=3237121 RepID=UPI0034C686AE